mmetsp:Transcript_90732/g.282643  ORF Transcript_90732/g.282643 Transcript_90732/m.282643 type:complete len:266 (+) Transcript_90732:744-1541(+)
MYGPQSLPSDILSRVVKMYDSKSFFLSSVSMISRISACIANSWSWSFCNVSSSRPGRPEAVMLTSVLFVRRFFFTTSTHSYRGSGALFSGALACGSFFSASASPSSGPLLSLFSLSPPASSASAILASPSPSFSAFSSSAGFSPVSSMGAVPFSCFFSASPSASADSCFFSASPSPSAGSLGLSSGSGGSSRFSFTTSSYSSSSSICAVSMLKVPCSVSLDLTLTFFASGCGGSSIRKVPSSLGVPGGSFFSSANSAFTSKGPVL